MGNVAAFIQSMESGSKSTAAGPYYYQPRLPELPITERTAKILWRDLLLLLLGAVALILVSFVETNAADAVSAHTHNK